MTAAPGRCGVLELPDGAGLVARDPRDGEHALAARRRPGSPPRCCRARRTGRPCPATWTTPMAPPRVCAIRRCARSTQHGRARSGRVVEDRGDRLRRPRCAASGPWPRPSHSTPVTAPSVCAAPKTSPHSVSPADRPDQAGAARQPRRYRGARARTGPPAPCRGPARSTGRRSRPAAGWRRGRCRGCRWWSGRRACAAPTSRRPGPGVDGDHLDARACRRSRAMRSSIDPWLACLCRLDAASVTASASWSARASGNCSRLASASAALRQAAAALASSTRSQRMVPGRLGAAAASSARPLDDHDAGARAGLGGQLELIDQPPRPGQAQARARCPRSSRRSAPGRGRRCRVPRR